MSEIKKGTPIFKKHLEACQYCLLPEKKSNKFPLCTNPVAYMNVGATGAFIIECASKQNECQFYNEQIKHINDVKLVRNYINKFSKDGWIKISTKHLKWLLTKVFNNSYNYLVGLFRYYGYVEMKDEHVENNSKLFSIHNGE